MEEAAAAAAAKMVVEEAAAAARKAQDEALERKSHEDSAAAAARNAEEAAAVAKKKAAEAAAVAMNAEEVAAKKKAEAIARRKAQAEAFKKAQHEAATKKARQDTTVDITETAAEGKAAKRALLKAAAIKKAAVAESKYREAKIAAANRAAAQQAAATKKLIETAANRAESEEAEFREWEIAQELERAAVQSNGTNALARAASLVAIREGHSSPTAQQVEESNEECAHAPGSPTGRQESDLMAAKTARQGAHSSTLKPSAAARAPVRSLSHVGSVMAIRSEHLQRDLKARGSSAAVQEDMSRLQTQFLEQQQRVTMMQKQQQVSGFTHMDHTSQVVARSNSPPALRCATVLVPRQPSPPRERVSDVTLHAQNVADLEQAFAAATDLSRVLYADGVDKDLRPPKREQSERVHSPLVEKSLNEKETMRVPVAEQLRSNQAAYSGEPTDVWSQEAARSLPLRSNISFVPINPESASPVSFVPTFTKTKFR